MSKEEENIQPGTNSQDVKKSSSKLRPAHISTDNNEQQNTAAEGHPVAENTKPPVEQGTDGNRMDAAKAFYRAMYAGGEVDAEKYGMKVESVISPTTGIGACANCDQLVAELEQIQAKATEIEGLYKRMAADFDNYRKRIDREREELVNIGIQKAVETLLPAFDDLDRAQANFNNNSDLSSVIESLKLIAARFSKCLGQLGIKPLETVGQTFDPRLHEPVQQIATTDVPEGSVIHDLRRGYIHGEKIIRPALVNVAMADSADPEADTDNNSADVEVTSQNECSATDNNEICQSDTSE